MAGTDGVCILSDADAWTQQDLERMAAIIEPHISVAEARQGIANLSVDLIPALKFVVGAGFAGFVAAMGKDGYEKLKKFIVAQSREFESHAGFKFHNMSLEGTHRGKPVSVGSSSKSHDELIATLDRWAEVVPAVDAMLDTVGRTA